MAEVGNFMTLDAGDIHSILGVETGDIETVMGFEVPSGGEQWFGSRHFMMGGYFGSDSNRISYKASTSSGDAGDFGDLTTTNRTPLGAGTGNGKARGVSGGGHDGSAIRDAIDYIATTSTQNAGDFGDMTAPTQSGATMSNGTLLFMAAGWDTDIGSRTDKMEYITVASTGNGTDAGNLLDQLWELAGASGDTRGAIFGGNTGNSADGYVGYSYATVDYIAFHTSNDAADFGDLSVKQYLGSACASVVRWVAKAGTNYDSATGTSYYIHMDYFTVDTLGNASDFGDMADMTGYTSGMADGTRGEWWGGKNASQADTDAIGYITIGSASDGTDAGNLHAVGYCLNAGLSGAAS